MGQFKCVNISTEHAAVLAYNYAPSFTATCIQTGAENYIPTTNMKWSDRKVGTIMCSISRLDYHYPHHHLASGKPASFILSDTTWNPQVQIALNNCRPVGRLGSLRIRCWISLKYALIVLNNGIRATFASRLFEAVQIASEAYPPTANFQAFTAKWSWGSGGSSTTDTEWHCQGIVSGANANKNPAEDVVQLRIYNSTVQFLAVLLLLKWH